MEFRVWVDGTQRVVCGVKLTTTCQEIVIALAHATQQAGRFTMIERWRNNERLLSPNEQPLVTLQRWGDHMNEVEFILRKTSTDIPSNGHLNQVQPQQRPSQQQPPSSMRPNHNDLNPQLVTTNGRRESPAPSILNKQLSSDQTFENLYPHRQYNVNRLSQALLGPLTSSHSSLGFGTNYLQPTQQSIARLPNSYRASISTSTLPNPAGSLTASPSNNTSISRPHYSDDQITNSNSSSNLRHTQNGYSTHIDNQLQQKVTNLSSQLEQVQISKNYPFEDLYSTINKKRPNQPPAVPAKPRVVGPLNTVPNPPIPQQQLNPINKAQMNYYNPNLNIYPNHLRPRHPPGYLDYMEAMANRSSFSQPMLTNLNYAQQNHQSLGSIFQRSFDHQQVSNMRRNVSSPIDALSTSNKYRYSANELISHSNLDQSLENPEISGIQNLNQIHTKFDNGLVFNRGSAVNVKLPSSSQNIASHSIISDNSSQNIEDSDSTVSQIGHDMLKVIEEQKKVLINQKNELDRLDNDQEYREKRQSSEQTELIARIENEIIQLEELWKENQAQIRKLEDQDFEKELEDLKSEQVRLDIEINKQREKLVRCEKELVLCKNKIQQLEKELDLY